MGKIIYITGAPATGKSTLCRALAQADPAVVAFCYSERLRDHVNASVGADLDEIGIRRESSRVVTPRHVSEVDNLLRNEICNARGSDKHLVIDSHPVTKEHYGFRVTPFSATELQLLNVDVLICLYAAPEILARRIRADPQGRPMPTEFELALHVQLQASVVTQYAVFTGRACYLLDSNCQGLELASKVRTLSEI